MLGGYGFQGQVTAGDGSDKKGKMGAGYNNLRRQKKNQHCKVGCEEDGSSSNRPELAAFFLALQDTLIEEPLLYLCDNQSLLKAVNRWIGKGGKATSGNYAGIHMSGMNVFIYHNDFKRHINVEFFLSNQFTTHNF